MSSALTPGPGRISLVNLAPAESLSREKLETSFPAAGSEGRQVQCFVTHPFPPHSCSSPCRAPQGGFSTRADGVTLAVALSSSLPRTVFWGLDPGCLHPFQHSLSFQRMPLCRCWVVGGSPAGPGRLTETPSQIWCFLLGLWRGTLTGMMVP